MEKEDEGMTKLGVSEGVDDEELSKAASRGCPKCGAACVKHGSILACPTHGTEPFEK